jgi:hypothetical protein
MMVAISRFFTMVATIVIDRTQGSTEGASSTDKTEGKTKGKTEGAAVGPRECVERAS